MSTGVRTLSRISLPRVSKFAKVYRTAKDDITVIMVGYGHPADNLMLVQFNVPGWDHPLNGRVIKHSVLIEENGKRVEFFNNKFAPDHNSIVGRDGFWRFQVSIYLPGIGERLAILDEEASLEVNTEEFVNCYSIGMKYILLYAKKNERKVLPKKAPRLRRGKGRSRWFKKSQ